jgi:CrcB protein
VTWLFLCVGAAVGAPTRYLIDKAVQARHDTVFPWGTLVVNLVGSLVLGLLAGLGSDADLPTWAEMGIGVGFCGAFTTYSTFGFETVRLVEGGARLFATANVVLSVVLGLAAAVGGYVAGRAW